ncbi:MAG: PAS domain S-box protein [Syntrophobacteraceae bacterium]
MSREIDMREKKLMAPCFARETRVYEKRRPDRRCYAPSRHIRELLGEVYLFGTASALYDSKGNIVGAIESIRDISERRRVEEALLRAEEKYRSIFENAMEGIYQTTPDGHFISVNPAFAQILGYDSPEELLHTIMDISQQLYANPKHRVELLRLLIEQGKVSRFETQFYRKNGSIAWITLNVRAVRDTSGQIIYLEGSAEDISERKALEARLFQVQKMEAIGTLAGGIAHDFNNILAPMIGYSELALQNIPAGTQVYQNIEQVIRSGLRAKDLVKQILTFSRKTEQKYGPVQVSLLVKETLQMLRSTLPSTIEIHRDIDRDTTSSSIIADPTQIHQVLMNLCTNAAHAMRETGGVLSIALAKVNIGSTPGAGIPDLEDGSYLRLSVSDTGHGMDEKIRQRIFDPYFTTKGQDEGTGLGLAVVYGIVKGLSGGITVSSNPGVGTTFQVFFPITETSDTASLAVPGRLPTGKGRILVVDDEKHVVEMLKEMLEQLGYEVALRYSSADALGAFQAQPQRFDLVITDQTMPHMTGTDLAKEILKIRPDIPIILCTGFSANLDEAKARKMGIKALLMKPVPLQQLAEKIHEVLNQK